MLVPVDPVQPDAFLFKIVHQVTEGRALVVLGQLGDGLPSAIAL